MVEISEGVVYIKGNCFLCFNVLIKERQMKLPSSNVYLRQWFSLFSMVRNLKEEFQSNLSLQYSRYSCAITQLSQAKIGRN